MAPQPKRRKKPKHDARHKPRAPAGNRPAQTGAGASALRVRKLGGEDAWELVHPRCARDRQQDLEEVRKMLDAGEVDVAIDECRWLLNGCSDCLEAHHILGEIALAENDLPLARGHFGYAYRLGVLALDRAGCRGPLPYRLPANRSFFESAKGLAYCLAQLGKPEMAAEVAKRTLECDPSDPLGMRGLGQTDPGNKDARPLPGTASGD